MTRSADEEAARLWRADGLWLSDMWRPAGRVSARDHARSREVDGSIGPTSNDSVSDPGHPEQPSRRALRWRYGLSSGVSERGARCIIALTRPRRPCPKTKYFTTLTIRPRPRRRAAKVFPAPLSVSLSESAPTPSCLFVRFVCDWDCVRPPCALHVVSPRDPCWSCVLPRWQFKVNLNLNVSQRAHL